MTKLSLDKDTILKRLNGIQNEIKELKVLSETPFSDFKEGSVSFRLAQFHLHRSLEGVFHISAHILSRIPGGQASEYKELAKKLGDYGIVPKDFAETKLYKMAGYRNRIVHFYSEISPDEIYKIITENLTDFDIFLSGVKNVLLDPSKFGIKEN